MKNDQQLFYLFQESIFAVPIIHYNMETAAHVCMLIEQLKPDCIAVELAETMQETLVHAASRLPDISVVLTYNQDSDPLYYMCEPCDACFEGLRCAIEANIPAYCIDLDVDYYPDIRELMPDPYAIYRIGLEQYYKSYTANPDLQSSQRNHVDDQRELYMAKRLKELSLRYERVLFIGGMAHVQNVLNLVNRSQFPLLKHADRQKIELCTLTENSCRDVLSECGWFSSHYEELRAQFLEECKTKKHKKTLENNVGITLPPDRQRLIYTLFKTASEPYKETSGNPFPGYHLRNIMKFARNYALLYTQLLPNLFQMLSAAQGCVDDNYAYEVWFLSTEYPHLKNIDSLPELDLKIEDVWGATKHIRFKFKQKGKKGLAYQNAKKNQQFHFKPPGMFSICSYQPEDIIVERFGNFLRKKGTQILTEESGRTLPFSTSLEEGIDCKETIRHWHEKKLYVKMKGKPPSGVGSIVIIFDEDMPNEEISEEKYAWRTTWIGEHNQESDMAFYATPITQQVIGPGISRCEYGGFMMSYPPRRLLDVWSDPDYQECRTKSEVLLLAAIDYAIQPVVVFVAAKAPRSHLKSIAQRYGKKLVYIPIGQLSPLLLNKMRIFHVLDGRNRREIADEYIF